MIRSRRLLMIGRIAIAALLASFFGFVGFMKAFAPMAELAIHRAWVVGLPVLLARAVGWSEMLCAALLLVGAVARPAWACAAAIVLIVNQLIALSVHLARGETGALTQNLLLVVLLGIVVIASRTSTTARTGAAAHSFGG
jgi:uncharacterized membrane protein YphA (DoxX/SURF4 family)